MKFKHQFFTCALFILIGVCAAPLAFYLISSSPYREIDSFLTQHQFQGSILIAQEGRILFSRGYGLANEEYQISNTPQTVFRIGSITKQFTAVAILQLQEQGKLNVYDSIAKYLPEYPQGDKITIHHLLSHMSGIPSITDFPNLQEIQRHPSTPHQVMAYFQDLPLKFEPGTNCDYSDSGYIILGAIIEKVIQKPYEDAIRERFFRPLGMNATYYDHHYSIIPNRATGYEKNDQGQVFHAHYLDMSFPHAAGALATTIEDLYKWDRALKEAKLLSKKSVDLLFTIHGSSQEHRITYGYGFFIGPHNQELEQASETIIGHDGTIEGFRAASFRYFDDDLTIILLSNVENTRINDLHLVIARIIRSSWRSRATL